MKILKILIYFPYYKVEKSELQCSNKQSRKADNFRIMRKLPFWEEAVSITPELIYQYQVISKSENVILAADLKTLESVKQPESVFDQLNQLCKDMEIDGPDSLLHDIDASECEMISYER